MHFSDSWMKSWYIFTTKLSVMIHELVLSAPEPKAGKPCRWERDAQPGGQNSARPAVATQDAHAMSHCTLPCENTISHHARSWIAICSAATPLSSRHVKSQWTHPKHALATMKHGTLPLVLCTARDRSTVAVLTWVHWPALNGWECGREQRSPSSERSRGTNVHPSAPLTKTLCGVTSVSTESKGYKKKLYSFSCGLSQVWDATTARGQRPGLGDSKSTRVVVAPPEP